MRNISQLVSASCFQGCRCRLRSSSSNSHVLARSLYAEVNLERVLHQTEASQLHLPPTEGGTWHLLCAHLPFRQRQHPETPGVFQSACSSSKRTSTDACFFRTPFHAARFIVSRSLLCDACEYVCIVAGLFPSPPGPANLRHLAEAHAACKARASAMMSFMSLHGIFIFVSNSRRGAYSR